MKRKEMIGRFNLIEIHVCDLPDCLCGWHMTIGSEDYQDLVALKKFLKHHQGVK